MKLPRYPKGLFYAGHSGRRFGAADMPVLRAMRETYRRFLDRLPEVMAGETDPAMLLAGATVKASLEADYAACGNVLALLERTPTGWRP
ncbi:MAG: hypothetical protein U0T03_13685 [Xanthomonadales bacterium]|nr:hypothetical protein [Xanthomonadales bacterium]